MSNKAWQTQSIEGVEHLVRSFKFSHYTETCRWVEALIRLAEQNDHHPDILFGYDYCQIRLTTHSAKQITDKDRQMTQYIDNAWETLFEDTQSS